MKVLIIEDDKQSAELISNGLTSDLNTVEIASDGATGSFLARSYDYDAIVLDYALPKKDGIEVCKEIRSAKKTTPIVFLSVTDESSTKIKAFQTGADDYVTKPFLLEELYERLKAVTRRPQVIQESILKIEDLTMDTVRNIVTRGEKTIHLTRKEFILLEYFLRNIGVLLSRALIIEHVWSSESDPFSNTVEAHIGNLRKKLNSSGRPNLIANIPGRGYVLNTPENLLKL